MMTDMATAASGSRSARTLGTIRGILPYLWPEGEWKLRLRVVVALGLLVLGRVLALGVPYCYARIVQHLSPQVSPVVLVPVALIAGYGVLQFFSHVLDVVRDSVFTPVALRMTRRLVRRGVQHMHALSLRFHLDRQTGALIRSVERGTEAVAQISRIVLFNILPSVIDTVLTLGVIWHLFGFAYVGVILAALVIYSTVTLRYTQMRIGIRRARNEAISEANHRLVDSLLNYETVKYFGAERFEDRRIDDAQERLEVASVRLQDSTNALFSSQNFIISLAATIVMVLAGHDVTTHRIDVGHFVMVNTYLMALYGSLTSIGWIYASWRSSRVDLEHLLDLLALEPDISDPARPVPLISSLHEVGAAEVVFDHVGFGYSDARMILRDVSFRVLAGTSLAIVGPTGAGKSTIARLLFRSYDVSSGAVRIDETDVRAFGQSDLHAAIGVVPQDTVLFNETVGYNIRYGRLDATKEEIEEAARKAQIHDFIASLPEGYETKVGERGLKLSGGEKQRIAIARVILKDPRILLLDEATSALDTRTEREIHGALSALSRARTTITVAHRLSTVQECDQILVLQQGRVVERGTHADLLALGGHYAAMWAAQIPEMGEKLPEAVV